MNIKPFSQVQIGDTCIDYNQDKYTIEDKGTLLEMMNMYRKKVPMGIDDYTEMGIKPNDPCIVIKTEPFPGGDMILYAYGPEGAYVLLDFNTAYLDHIHGKKATDFLTITENADGITGFAMVFGTHGIITCGGSDDGQNLNIAYIVEFTNLSNYSEFKIIASKEEYL